ncbi:hypothetical protein MRX96_020814 [Rhipicephalus microplus]
MRQFRFTNNGSPHVPNVWRRRRLSTSRCSALATPNDASDFSTHTVVWTAPLQLARCPTSSEATEHPVCRATPSLKPPPAEEDNETVVSRAGQRRARALEATAIAKDFAVAGTVLYRPSTPGCSFMGSLHLTLAAALAEQHDATAVRVNHLRNIVAADAVTPACLSELLTVKELSGVPVTAREPVDRRSSIGFVHGTGGDLVDSELTAGITSAVPFFSASKEG